MSFGYFLHIVLCLSGIIYMTLFHSFSFLFLSFLPLQSPTVISLYVRFWYSPQLRFRTLQLQCHHVGDGGTRPTVPHFTTVHTPAQPPPKFQVACSSQHMSVKLPPGPTSGLIVQGEFEVGSGENICVLSIPNQL